MQSSALSDGVEWLRSCSARTVAAHVSIEVTEHHHRQSSVVRHRKVCGHRQDNVVDADYEIVDDDKKKS